MIIYLLFYILSVISLSNTKQNEKNKQDEKVISIFRGSGIYKSFKIIIDKKYNYLDTCKTIENGAFGELITKYKTKNSFINIYLKVNGKDTAFNYNISKHDSLMMGVGDKHFFIFNEDEYVWAND